ncbi:hypothetical protein CLOSTMETH_02942 [[Clostridium] methylpentosum DSM 5476]|uniref:Uncharacterized protein n=1 Tax=[Clostridium] methylpentosum DSM 5476 TaxID=537013 RepID=C0EGE9_9FIRM|nr:hypothetical protein CLOSTMETH_02942 [[Clostridium] methylpentosum DSM 5476]
MYFGERNNNSFSKQPPQASWTGLRGLLAFFETLLRNPVFVLILSSCDE